MPVDGSICLFVCLLVCLLALANLCLRLDTLGTGVY